MDRLYMWVISSAVVVLSSIIFAKTNKRKPPEGVANKYRVKDTSVLRKLLHFRDTEQEVHTYFTVLPPYLALLVAIGCLVIWGVDMGTNHAIESKLPKSAIVGFWVSWMLVCVLYYLVLFVWWDMARTKTRSTNREVIKMGLAFAKQAKKAKGEQDELFLDNLVEGKDFDFEWERNRYYVRHIDGEMGGPVQLFRREERGKTLLATYQSPAELLVEGEIGGQPIGDIYTQCNVVRTYSRKE